MKKIFLSLAIVLAVFSSAFAHAPSSANDRAAASFKKDFHKASEVSWVVTANYVQAKFQLDKETMFAYYDFDGNLIGVIHHILTTDLSTHLQKDIKKNYASYWVSELFKVTSEQGDNYFIQLKNADETIVLTSDGSSDWHKYALPKNTIEKL